MAPSVSFMILGTVQLGMPYGLGLAGRAGLDDSQAAAVLDAAAERGVTWLDTARAYGQSEARIGKWLSRQTRPIRLTSKLRKLQDVPDADIPAWIRQDIEASLAALGQKSIDTLLTHNGEDIRRRSVQRALQQSVEEGLIHAYGASVYTPEDAAASLACEGLSHLQIPVSLLNQAFLEHDALPRARQAGIVIHARSLFTQGLLFLDPENLPDHLQAAAPALQRLRGLAREAETDLAALAIAALATHSDIDGAVIGCDTPEQVRTAADSITGLHIPSDLVDRAMAVCRGLPQAVVDPRLWPKQDP